MTTNNGTGKTTPEIKPEWRLIHITLHGKADSLRLGRKVYDIMVADNGCRYMDYDNIRFVQQNPAAKTEMGRRARKGERITWCNPHDGNTPVFAIDQHALLQRINQAVITLPMKTKQDATITAKPTVPAKAKRGNKPAGASVKKPAAKRGGGKLGGK